MPAVWLAWSAISFLICIASIIPIWRAGNLTRQMEEMKLGLRILMFSQLFLGIVSLVLSNITFRRDCQHMAEWLQTLVRHAHKCVQHNPSQQSLHHSVTVSTIAPHPSNLLPLEDHPSHPVVLASQVEPEITSEAPAVKPL